MNFKRICLIFSILTALGVPAGSAVAGPDLLPERFLYFVHPDGAHLTARPGKFPMGLGDHDLGMTILRAICAAPPDPSLASAWPPGTNVNALFIGDDGRAWVDMALEGGGLENPDTRSELLAVYSVVNSLTLNIPAVKKVKLLVNGTDAPSLGGHVSLRYFYTTEMTMVK